MVDDWIKNTLTEVALVRDALELLSTRTHKTLLVTNTSGRLLGVVTDGDIRRGFLSGHTLDDPVTQVMNRNPQVAVPSASRQQIKGMMKASNVLAIPIIDDGRLVGLEVDSEAQVGVQSHDTPIFIMAGGFGSRLRPLTDKCPKPMLELAEKPMLEILIRQFKSEGFSNFFISTHYLPEKITNYFGSGRELGVDIKYVYEEKPLGTGGALGLLPRDLGSKDPIIMINGDILTTVNFSELLKYHYKSKGLATMCTRDYEYQVPFGVVTPNGIFVEDILEKPVQKFNVNAGIYVLSQDLRKYVLPNKFLNLPNLLQMVISGGDDVSIFPIHEYWLDIGRIEDFTRAKSDIYSLSLL